MGLSNIIGGLIQHSLQPSSEEILQDKLKTQAALFGQQKQQRQGILDELNINPVQRAMDIQAQQAQNYATHINAPKSLDSSPYQPTARQIGNPLGGQLQDKVSQTMQVADELLTPIFESFAPPEAQERADYYAQKAEEARNDVPRSGLDHAMKLYASQYLGQTGQSHSVANTMINNQGAMNRLREKSALTPQKQFNNVQLNAQGVPIGLNQQGQFQNIPTQPGFVPVPKRNLAPNITVGGESGFTPPHEAAKGFYWNTVSGKQERIPNALESSVSDTERKAFYQYEQMIIPYDTYKEVNKLNDEISSSEYAASHAAYNNDPTNFLMAQHVDPNLRREFASREPLKDAMLRADSGAALTEYEINNIDKVFFRMPTDTAEMIEDKRNYLESKITAMKRRAGKAVDLYDSQRSESQGDSGGFTEEEIAAAMGE